MTVAIRFPNRRAPFGLPLVLVAVLMVLVQVLIFREMLDRTVGFHWPFGGGIFGFAPEKPSVALLRSQASAQLTPSQSDYYYELTRQWEVVLKDAGIPFRVISDAELASGAADRHTVLVLPSARCLGEPQRRRISAFLDSGKGLVASGGLGVRDADCKWTGYDYLTRIAGLRAPYPVAPSAMEYATFRGARYYSGSLPAGFALALPEQELIAGEAKDPDVFRSDAHLLPAAEPGIEKNALAVHGRRGRGRYVWFGFSETQPASRHNSRAQLDQFLISAVRWTARQPLAYPATWPNNRRAAVLIGETMSDEPKAATLTASMFARLGVPATFFVPGALAAGSPEAVKALAAAGEVAALGDASEPFGQQELARQTERLARSKETLANLRAARTLGFYPPHDQINHDTEAALVRAKYTYYVGDGLRQSASPEIYEPAQEGWFRLERSAVTRFGRPWADDFEVISAYTGPTPWGDDLGNGFLNDYAHAVQLGGLYTFLFSGDLLGAAENLHIVESVVRKMSAGPVWVASGSDLADWWLKRDNLRVVSRLINRQRIRLAVTNRGDRALGGASITVHLPYRPDTVRLIPAVHGRRLPSFRMLENEEALRLDFPEIPSQSSHVFLVALDEK